MAYRDEILFDNPRRYFRLNDTNATAIDSSANATNGTYNGTYTQTQAGALVGDADHAVLFSTGGYVQCNDPADLQLTQVSLEAWVKSTSAGGFLSIFEKSGSWSMFLSSGHLIVYDYAAAPPAAIDSGVTINDGNWHHVVAILQSGTNKSSMWVDGTKRLTFTYSLGGSSGNAGSSGNLTISAPSDTFPGTIDEAAVYARVLPDDRILDHYQVGTGGSPIPPVPSGDFILSGPSIGKIGSSITLTVTATDGFLGGNVTFAPEDAAGNPIASFITGGNTQSLGSAVSKNFTATLPNAEGPVILKWSHDQAGVTASIEWVPTLAVTPGYKMIQVQKHGPPLRVIANGTLPPGVADWDTYGIFGKRSAAFLQGGDVPYTRLPQGTHVTAIRAWDYFGNLVHEQDTVPSAAAADVEVPLPELTNCGSYLVSFYREDTLDGTFGNSLWSDTLTVYKHDANLPDFPDVWGNSAQIGPSSRNGLDYAGTGDSRTNQLPDSTGTTTIPSPFGQKWKGKITPPNSGGTAGGHTYTFKIATNGGARLTVNGKRPFDYLNLNGSQSKTATITVPLSGGLSYDIELIVAGTITSPGLQYQLDGAGAFNNVPGAWFTDANNANAGHLPVTYYPVVATWTRQFDLDPVAMVTMGYGCQRLEIKSFSQPTAEVNQALQSLNYWNSQPDDAVNPRTAIMYGVWYRRKTFQVGAVTGGAAPGTVYTCGNADFINVGTKVVFDDGVHTDTLTCATVNKGANTFTTSDSPTHSYAAGDSHGNGTVLYQDHAQEDTGVASAAGTLYAAGAKWASPQNEPDVNPGSTYVDMSAAECAASMAPFIAAVHAGAPNMKIMAPPIVEIRPSYTGAGSFFRSFIAAGGAAAVDGWSFHYYNGIDGETAQGIREISDINAYLTAQGLGALTKFQTEQSYAASNYNTFNQPHQARWHFRQRLALDRSGVPSNRDYSWHFHDPGDSQFPHYVETSYGSQSLHAEAQMQRTYRINTWGRQYNSALNFGPSGEYTFGNVYHDPNNVLPDVFMLLSHAKEEQATFNVSGGDGTLHVEDCFGNASTVPVTNGQAAVSGFLDPLYVKPQSGQAVALVTPSYGSDVLAAKVPTTTGSTSGLSLLTNGQKNYNYAYGAVYIDNYPAPSTYPFDLLWDLSSVVSGISRVIVETPAPWQANGTSLWHDVQTSPDGSTWTTAATFKRLPKVVGMMHQVCNGVNQNTVASFYDGQHVFNHSFAPVNARYLRLRFYLWTYGGEADRTLQEAGGQAGLPVVTISRVRAFVSPPQSFVWPFLTSGPLSGGIPALSGI